MKIWRFLKKTWYIFVILIVAYIVLGKLKLLPARINLFASYSAQILNTPVLVKEMREIGELVSAEYYGEVYADLFEAMNDILENFDSLPSGKQTEYMDKYPHLKDYKKSQFEVQRLTNLVDTLSKMVVNFKPRIDSEQDRLEYYKKSMEAKKIERDNLSRFSQRAEFKNADAAYKEAENAYEKAEEKLETTQKQLANLEKQIKDTKDNLSEAQDDLINFKKKNNLVYIGRGWVKAGFNLKKLNPETDIYIDEGDSLLIHIEIPEPEILDTVINPWFIPEKKIMGYEIFIKERNDFSHLEVTEVKRECVRKLARVAIEKGLLEMAEKTGKQTLEGFFQLLGFEKVEISIKGRTQEPKDTTPNDNTETNEASSDTLFDNSN